MWGINCQIVSANRIVLIDSVISHLRFAFKFLPSDKNLIIWLVSPLLVTTLQSIDQITTQCWSFTSQDSNISLFRHDIVCLWHLHLANTHIVGPTTRLSMAYHPPNSTPFSFQMPGSSWWCYATSPPAGQNWHKFWWVKHATRFVLIVILGLPLGCTSTQPINFNSFSSTPVYPRMVSTTTSLQLCLAFGSGFHLYLTTPIFYALSLPSPTTSLPRRPPPPSKCPDASPIINHLGQE